ncbi:MAG: hypothetical protein AAF580_01870, partial [Pseudomonadota bacterium]
SYHLAFNIGFPNQFDRSLNRTGSHLMVHGDCSSRGCYAMEDDQIEEIYALARDAFRGGQGAFQIQAFPFRMTAENLARHRDSEHYDFWKMLKVGYDHFEVTKQPPRVSVCGQEYKFNVADTTGFDPQRACPAYQVRPDVEQLVAEKVAEDNAAIDLQVARIQKREERQDRWAEREKAIASFFNTSRGVQSDDSAGEETSERIVAAGLTPVPRRVPADERSAVAVASAPQQSNVSAFAPSRVDEDTNSLASRFGRLFGNRGSVPEPEAVVVAAPQPAAAAAQADQAQPVASIAAADAAPVPDEEDGGFVSNVAKSSKGLFRRVGSIFN